MAASTRKGVRSVGLSLIFWTIGFLIAAAQLSVFIELSSYFPNRSGAEVVYLEQAYPRPKYLMATTSQFSPIEIPATLKCPRLQKPCRIHDTQRMKARFEDDNRPFFDLTDSNHIYKPAGISGPLLMTRK
jgi:hypothetical protein